MGETTGTDSTADQAPQSASGEAVEATRTTPPEGEFTPTVEYDADSPPGDATASGPEETASLSEETPSSSEETAEATEDSEVFTGGHEILRHRASRSLRAFLGRPATRLGFALSLTLALLGVAGAAGAYLVPHTAGPSKVRAVSESPDPDGLADDENADGGLDPADDVDLSEELGDDLPQQAPLTVGRPADALATWAFPIASKLGIPSAALESYAYAELVLKRTSPNCGLSWTTLAGIGKVESNHGRTGGSTLTADGKALPPIRGIPLNGQGVDAIPDTDGGRLDGDPIWDRAVGPMQFIPSTWQRYAVDADNDGTKDPNDLDDAALAAGVYLCASGKDVSTASGWYAAVLTYNAVRVYASQVFSVANDYGIRSRN